MPIQDPGFPKGDDRVFRVKNPVHPVYEYDAITRVKGIRGYPEAHDIFSLIPSPMEKRS
jgi:hypothetical protein